MGIARSLSLTDTARTIMNAKTHPRGDGVALFYTLRQIYKSTLSNISLSNKFSKLTGGPHFRAYDESIDAYAARTILLAKDLNDNNWTVSPTLIKYSFIIGLGSDFTDIIEKHNKQDLPKERLPMDINDLIVPARSHHELKLDLRHHNRNYKLHFSTNTKTSSSDVSKAPTDNTSTPKQLSPKDQDR